MQQNRIIHLLVGIIALVIIIALYIKMERYMIVGTGGGAYKMDRLTGQTWYLTGARQIEVREHKFWKDD